MTQIGFVGLGKMGGNMVHRIRRDSEHEVVAFDFDKKAVKQAVKHGASGADSLKILVKQLKPPRIVWIMVPAGEPTQQTRREARQAARPRRHDRRRRQLEVDRRQAPLEGAEGQGHRIRRCRRLRRRVGPRSRLLHDGRRPAQGRQAAGADPRRARARDQRAEPRGDRTPRLAALRPLGRRPLREDGPQRRRVRPDAGLRGGLRRVRQVRVRARQRRDRAPVGPGLGGALVAVRTGGTRLRSRRQRPGARSRATPRTPARAAGRSPTRPPTTCPLR